MICLTESVIVNAYRPHDKECFGLIRKLNGIGETVYHRLFDRSLLHRIPSPRAGDLRGLTGYQWAAVAMVPVFLVLWAEDAKRAKANDGVASGSRGS